METKIEKLKQSRIRTTTVVPAEDRTQAEQEALRSLAKQVRIKGFREGMAPPEMVREHVKKEQLMEETVRAVLPKVLAAALKDSGAKPIIRPNANVTSMEPLTITLTFVERPAVELKKPDNIKVEKKPLGDATPQEIEEFINKLLRQDGTEVPVDRVAAKGDIVKVSLTTKDKSGEPVNELTVGHYSVTLGSEEVLPELEQHITGMKKGDVKKVDIDFPKSHDIPVIQGKKLNIEITAKEVAEAKLPELTADYIKTRLGAERTPEAFRTEIGQMLTNQKRGAEMKRREEELYAKVKAATQIDVAPELIDAEVQEMLRDLQERLKQQQTTVEQWLESTGKKWEEVVDEMKGIAKERIVLRFGMQMLADHRKAEPDATKLAASLESERMHAQEHGQTIPEAELKPGGSVYEQASWELKMQKLVTEMIDDEPAAMKKAA